MKYTVAHRSGLAAHVESSYRSSAASHIREHVWCPCSVHLTRRCDRVENLKFIGLTQNMDELLGTYRDFQSNCWVNLRIVGQPCGFYRVGESAHTLAARSGASGCAELLTRGATVARALPGRLRAPQRFPPQIGFAWRAGSEPSDSDGLESALL